MRYALGQKGKIPLIIFGINPSVAEPKNSGKSDPTIDKVIRVAEKLNFDGWIMLNLYPQRSTDPNQLNSRFDEKIHLKNLEVIQSILNDYPNATIVAAWGNLIKKREYLKKCLDDIDSILKNHDLNWNCFQLNKTGNPKHPLYIKVSEVKLFPLELQK